MKGLSEFWEQREFARFLTVGLWNTAFAFMAFAVLYWLLHKHLHYLVIGCLAHVAAVVNAFIFQRQLVFRSRTDWRPAFLRFFLIQAGLLVWGIVGLTICVELLHLHPWVSQIILTLIAVFVSYSLNRRFAFRISLPTNMRPR